MNENIERVRRAVIEQLEDLAPQYTGKIVESDRLLKDLKLTSDDATIFAMQSGKRLGITVPPKAWMTVVTVGDAIELLASYARSGDSQR